MTGVSRWCSGRCVRSSALQPPNAAIPLASDSPVVLTLLRLCKHDGGRCCCILTSLISCRLAAAPPEARRTGTLTSLYCSVFLPLQALRT
ncbi:hypothetical protein GDO78_019654 [Eleutherodactylus coqui]|uniref:Uncharacterized protein n=1 Tax=Eleutherodactylus coqui TaxID=57060 RepID=A0A8J6BD25_ELECQ|nr:hypothetical protein GDO78_019654 [Eleutherodactylus coqui]